MKPSKNGKVAFDLVEHYAYKSMRGKTANRPLPDDLQILQTVIVRMQRCAHSGYSKGNLFALPFFIWGIFYDEQGRIAGIDALERTGKTKDNTSLYHLELSSDNHLHCRDDNNQWSSSYVKANFLRLVKNSKDDFCRLSHERLNSKFLPDIILRRAAAHAICPHIDERHSITLEDVKGLTRHGIVMNSIFSNKCRFPDRALDTGFYPIKQKPFTIPGYLEQGDIDTIALIAMNYVSFCWTNQRKIIWPKTGTWPNWPKELMRFTYERNPDIDIDTLQAALMGTSHNIKPNAPLPACYV